MTTVALPIWESDRIVWLQLESLCRQQEAGEWELIVSACESSRVHDIAKSKYLERLRDAGCQKAEVIWNPNRMPLGLKWRQIARVARGDAMLLCAADNYSYPTRIKEAAEHVAAGADFVDVNEGVFLDLNTGATATWARRKEHTSGLFMAYRTRLLQNLNDNPPDRFIDGWIKKQVGELEWVRLGARDGLHTDGANTISHHRAAMYNNKITPPFHPASQNWRDILPQSVVQDLDDMMTDLRMSKVEVG